MKQLILCFMVPLFVSCASTEDDAPLYDEANAAISKAKSLLVAEKCDQLQIKDKDSDLKLDAGNCGLLYDSLVSDGQLQKQICPELKLKGSACVKKAGEAFTARLGEKYIGADFEKIDQTCKAYPLKCKDLRSTELVILELHNVGVLKGLRLRLNQIDDSIAQNKRARDDDARARRAAAFGSIANSMKSQPASYSAPVQTAPSYKSHYCTGIKPIPQYNCRVACINGDWSQVCN